MLERVAAARRAGSLEPSANSDEPIGGGDHEEDAADHPRDVEVRVGRRRQARDDDHRQQVERQRVLSDLGAEVIKIEHVTRGDAMRGLASSGIAVVPGNVHVLLEHSNRGKKSLGLDLTAPDGIEILYKLAATSDVFLTNKLPSVRERLAIDLDHIRAHNPRIIYVRGTGQGERGPDADKGSYDSLAFWARAGIALGAKRPEYELIPVPPAPGFGDSIGGMTIAGGIMGALFHRERTGEATVVDVSLLGTGLWAMGQAMALSLVLERPWAAPPADFSFNPLTRNYVAKDGRVLAFTCLQAAKYWPMLCDVIGRPELKNDARFADQPALLANTGRRSRSSTRSSPRRRSPSGGGASMPSRASGASSRTRSRPQKTRKPWPTDICRNAARPMGFHSVWSLRRSSTTKRRPALGPAPKFNEHGDEILANLGLDRGCDHGPEGPWYRGLSLAMSAAHPRIALVTGASSGLGAAIALEMAALGWRIAIGGRREDRLAETAEKARAQGAAAVLCGCPRCDR